MNEELLRHIENFRQIQWQSLLRADRGDYHLKELKPHLDFIKNFLTEIIDHSAFESNYSLLNEPLQNNLIQFEVIQHTIKEYKDDTQKQDIISQIIEYRKEMSITLNPLLNILKQEEEYRLGIRPDPDAEYSTKYYAKLAKEFRQRIEQITQKQNQLQSQFESQTVRDEASRYGDFFKEESETNNKKSLNFRWGVWLASVGFCAVAYFWFPFPKNLEVDSFSDLIVKGNIMGKVFIFSIMILLITLLRKEYLALRHQTTLDKHRHNALASHKEILNSIQKTANTSDKEISNAILLELTKAMFNPQDTGFIKDQKQDGSGNKIVEVSKTVLNTPQSPSTGKP